MTTRVDPAKATPKSDARMLGLVAGLGVGAAVFYYRALVKAHVDRGLSPRMLMVHADVRHVMRLAQERRRDELASYLAGLLAHLAAGGATIATIPAFSPQVCAQELAVKTPLPLISLLDAIRAEVERRAYTRVAILGARVTMETRLFGSLGDRVDVIPLPAEDLDMVSRIYQKVVEQEGAPREEIDALRRLARRLTAEQRVDGVILAGTDWSFVLTPETADFPHVDGARAHIAAIMREVAP